MAKPSGMLSRPPGPQPSGNSPLRIAGIPATCVPAFASQHSVQGELGLQEPSHCTSSACRVSWAVGAITLYAGHCMQAPAVHAGVIWGWRRRL
eukprot:661816-Pelagomonas_calceolata.AAC.3